MDSSKSNFSDIQRLATIPTQEIFEELSSSEAGLDREFATDRLNQVGRNGFDLMKRSPVVLQYLLAFFSPLPILLIALALVSFLIGEANGATVIALMVFLSTTFAFFQEYRSSKAAEKLKVLVGIKVLVFRQEGEMEIPLDELVPGDVVLLSAGDLIPADLRLFSAKDLFVDQSSLTGEAMPVEKFETPSAENTSSPFDLGNMCFMGSHIVSGIGKGIITHTGRSTYFGGVVQQIATNRSVSSFDVGIQKFIWLMIKFMAVMVPIVFLINGLVKGDWLEAFLFAVAVAVGMTPEMLPLLVTINLAKGAISMSRKKVIVKRLNSIQNLGAMDVLCTDKTGTLTQNEIILERYVNSQGVEDERVLEFAYLNSHYQSGMKNLMDVAVLKHVDLHQKLHSMDAYQKVDEIPFDFQRRRMSVVLKKNHQADLLVCKGAAEEVAACCSHIQVGDRVLPLSDEQLQIAKHLVEELNEDGFRVIAVAVKVEESDSLHYSAAQESDLTLIGYVAFLDPPKESAKPAIKLLRQSGVQVKILTGDNPIVARKVCSQVGLTVSEVLLGSEMEKMGDDELAVAVQSVSVFAKLTPQQKSRVIAMLQKNSHVVGFMGDGINDGPALRMADVGISVDLAVDIAKDAADIILLEKSLLVLHDGVIEGRRVFANIMKYIKMSSSSNFGNMFSMIGASAVLPFLPMAPVQILLNNFLYDCSQTSVPSDAVDEEFLSKPYRWEIGNIAKFMICIGPISSVFDYATFAFLWFVLGANSVASMSLFQTGWFVESLLSQTLIVHIIRTNKIPFIQSRASLPLLATTVLICIVGIALPYTLLGDSMQMHPLPTIYWMGLVPILMCYFFMTQAVKTMLYKRYRI